MQFIDGRKLDYGYYSLIESRAENTVVQKQLLRVEDGGPEDFDFSILRMEDETTYFAPKHRHMWSQIRLGIEGTQNYKPGNDIVPGEVGYFPEGTWYGPQRVKGPLTMAVLQFGGPSRGGYLSHSNLRIGTQAALKKGVFKKGLYEYEDAEGQTHHMDGYQASWEGFMGRSMVYPPAQYSEPIIMDPAKFEWEPVAGEPGNFTRRLGTFSSGQVELRMVRADAGATYRQGTQKKRELLFVVDGVLEDGTMSLGPHSALYTLESELAQLKVTQAFSGLLMVLPSF